MANSITAPAGFPINIPTAVDVALSPEGDLMVGGDGDLQLCFGTEALVQTILFRLKTHRGDYRLEPNCGASLDDIIGQPMSPATGDRIRDYIVRALTHDKLFDPTDIEVITAPISELQIGIVLVIDTSSFLGVDEGESLSLEITVDLQEGLII